jgi:hypothetical protein
VRFAGKEDEQEDNVIAEVAVPSKKKSFFMMDDGSQEDQLWNVVALPQFEERGIGDSKPMPKPVKRASCWHCLRFYAEETGVEFKHPDITTKVSVYSIHVYSCSNSARWRAGTRSWSRNRSRAPRASGPS